MFKVKVEEIRDPDKNPGRSSDRSLDKIPGKSLDRVKVMPRSKWCNRM
jgi:hypothetical protein